MAALAAACDGSETKMAVLPLRQLEFYDKKNTVNHGSSLRYQLLRFGNVCVSGRY
jgi:hypothetical protein